MNKALLTALLGSFLVTLTAARPARAEEVQPSRPYVVLVGISDYADKEIKSRPHAEDDVKALYDLFTRQETLGADPANVRLLLGKEDAGRKSQPATRENILKALHWVATEAKRDDLVVFAFVGEGAPLNEQGDRLCYFASDSTVKDRAKNAVAATEIAQELDKLKSHRFCAFLDVSFKGAEGKGVAAELHLEGNPFKEFLGSDGKEEDHGSAPGRVAFLATGGRTRSLDLEKHGLFGQVVVDGLKGAADKEGYEPDGVVTVDELTDYLDKELPALARKFGKTKEQKEQQNYVLGGRDSHFVIVRNPAVTSKVGDWLKKLQQLAKDNKISAELAKEGQSLLSQMPKLESQRQLRKEYQKLVAGNIEPAKFQEARAGILDGTKMKRGVAEAYARKVIEATQMIKDGYVKEVNQGEMVAGAVRGLYRRLEEKIPPDLNEKLTKVKELKEPELVKLLTDVRERLGKREDLDNHKDIDISLQQMLKSLDPYTTYIDSDTLDKFKTDTQGQFTGIGIQITKDPARDMLKVVTPIKGSPAYEAGILEGDIITTITREVDSLGKPLDKPEVISTKGLSTNDAVTRIKGREKTKVKLTIERPGTEKSLDFELARARVELESVHGVRRKTEDDNWDYMVDHANKIAYVRLTNFARNTYRDLARVMRELEKEKVQGFVLDLRFNPGGLLDSAVKISDLYIDDGVIVSIRPRAGKGLNYTGDPGGYLNFPMVCLVNGHSASGSEIVAACLQDHHRAVVMGERSYGKGSVQNIADFEGGQLKMTTASFWRPSEKNLNKSSTSGKDEDEWGVTPDKGFVLKLSRKERDDLQEHQRDQEIIHRHDLQVGEPKPEFKDRQLDMALEYLRGQIKTASRPTTKKAG